MKFKIVHDFDKEGGSYQSQEEASKAAVEFLQKNPLSLNIEIRPLCSLPAPFGFGHPGSTYYSKSIGAGIIQEVKWSETMNAWVTTRDIPIDSSKDRIFNNLPAKIVSLAHRFKREGCTLPQYQIAKMIEESLHFSDLLLVANFANQSLKLADANQFEAAIQNLKDNRTAIEDSNPLKS